MTAKTTTIAEHIVGSLRNVDYMALTERYAPDTLLDVNLPMWRFQLQGLKAIKQHFHEQMVMHTNARCTQLRALVARDAVAVESECHFDGPDGESLWRCIDLVRIVGDEIVEHTQYSTGSWSPADVARQADEAPMVRW